MKEIKLSDMMETHPEKLWLWIGLKAKKMNKRYCFGQPQLKNGKCIFVNSLEEGIYKFGIGFSEFPKLFINCKD